MPKEKKGCTGCPMVLKCIHTPDSNFCYTLCRECHSELYVVCSSYALYGYLVIVGSEDYTKGLLGRECKKIYFDYSNTCQSCRGAWTG